jgi:protein O-GlcNAc transferase
VDYQRFIEQLPGLYTNWGQASVHPQSEAFDAVLEQVKETTTANVMQLLNVAVECMEADEVYCEIGCSVGANLIGALLNHPLQMAYAVDNFSASDAAAEKLNQLNNNLAAFNLEDQVFFCNQETEEFFFDLREMQTAEKIGVYFYAAAKDYRSQLLGLMLAQPFLADKALIVVDGSNYSSVQQACWDFMAAQSQCQLLLDCSFGNGVQVFCWDVNIESGYKQSVFEENFRNKPFIKAICDFQSEFEFNIKKELLEQIQKSALTLDFSRRFSEAEQKYKEIIQLDRNNANAYHNLGIVYFNMERYQDALAMLLKSLSLDYSKYFNHYSLGLVLEKLGDIQQAIKAYEQAIALNTQFVDAYNNLGNLLAASGLLEQAELIYRQAIAVSPQHFGSYLNLANVLMAQRQFDVAIDFYQKARELNPRNPDILHNLGSAFAANGDQVFAAFYFGFSAYYQGKYEEAIEHYQKVLANHPGNVDVFLYLADCYKNLKQHSAAFKTYESALIQYPNASEIYIMLILELQDLGRTQSAMTVADRAVQLIKNDVALKIINTWLLPIIYENTEDIEFYRNRFAQLLDDLIQQTVLDSPDNKKQALLGIGRRTHFYLTYQGKNDLELQSKYGQFVHKVMAANYPQWAESRSITPLSKTSKIRLGYVSHSLSGVGSLFLGWLKRHVGDQFQVYCYYTGRPIDSMTKQFELYSHEFGHIADNLEALCEQIVTDELHILVFLEIGMEAILTQVAGLRLAPIQCLTWGHPITSGLPTIDYFLSSNLMEPENAQEHYSEKLIRLPNLAIPYAKTVMPKEIKSRADLGIRNDAVVFLSCQSLFKYLPQYDYIFATIAQRVPQAQFVFVESHISDYITNIFRQRLQKAFVKFGLNIEEYCSFLPRLNKNDYLSLNLVSDIFLDTFTFSGGITTLNAIECNLPVVTCPGEFMRGRQSYGILHMIGVTETIAKDEAEYIEIAVRLGLDKQWRQSIEQQISQNQERLYDDQNCVEALEQFYRQVVQIGKGNN